MNLVDTIKWARNFAMLLVQMWSHHEALWCFIFVSFLGCGTLTIFLSTVAAALTIVFKSKVLLIPELWKHLKESGIGFFVSFTDVYVVSIWILRMRVIWLHHIVVVCLLWSLWAYCVKGGKTRVIKSRFVQVLNVIGWEGGASFLDQSHGEVKQNHGNHRLLSTLNWKMLYYMKNATLKIV